MRHRRKQLIPHTIQGTLLMVLVVALLPVLLLQPAVHYLRFESRRDQELAANLQLARLAASSFQAYVDEILRQEILIGVALTSAPSFNVEQRNRLLVAGANERSSVGYYSWIDPAGRIIASSDPESIGLDVSHHNYFKDIVAGKEWVVSDLRRNRPEGEPVFMVTRGIRDDSGALLGVVGALLDAGHLSNLLQVDPAHSSSIIVIDKRGEHAEHHANPESFQDGAPVESDPIVRNALAGREATGTFVSGTTGERRIGAFTPVESYGWVVGASRPARTALLDIAVDFLREFSVYLMVGLAAFLVALAIGRTLTGPVHRLREHALALTGGESGRRVPVGGPIELRELAMTFNRMADAIEARTRELGLLIDLEHAVQAAGNLDAALSDLASGLAKAVDVPICRVSMLVNDGRDVVVRASYRADSGEQAALLGKAFPIDDVPPARQVIEHRGETVEVSDPESELLSDAERLRWRSVGLCSALGVPLATGDRVIGLLTLGDVKRRQFSAEEKRLCLAVAHQTAGAIEKASLYQQIAEERQRLDAIVQNASDGIILLDDQMRVLTMNPAMELLTGSKVQEVMGAQCREVMSSTDAAGVCLCNVGCPMERAIAAGGSVPYAEVVVTAKGGTARELSVSYTQVRLSPTQNGYGVIIARDITQRKAVEKLKDEFVSLLSHDLRQPVAVIKGFAEIVQRRLAKTGTQDDTARYAEQIVSGSRRLEGMIADLVDSARLESGRLSLRRRPVDLADVVLAAVRSRVPPPEQARVRVEPATGLLPVEADAERLERVVGNLLSNALKYSPDGETVVVKLAIVEGRAVVSVHDGGAGVSEQDLPRLFDRFYRTANAKQREGLGLGLYISKMLVEAHGGTIWAESQANDGSTFSFAIPLSNEDDEGFQAACPSGASSEADRF